MSTCRYIIDKQKINKNKVHFKKLLRFKSILYYENYI